MLSKIYLNLLSEKMYLPCTGAGSWEVGEGGDAACHQSLAESCDSPVPSRGSTSGISNLVQYRFVQCSINLVTAGGEEPQK